MSEDVFARGPHDRGDVPEVAVLMGSPNDWATMKACAAKLEELGVGFEVRVISAHRTPGRHATYVEAAKERGTKLFICAAGLAAHLAGVTAATTDLPVIGVPMKGGVSEGLDALLATVQMPAGVPVATVAVGSHGARNAAILALQMLALGSEAHAKRLADMRAQQTADVPLYPQD